ncbi:MAG: beta-lactamase family protein [Oscillospiraceae bacterium]|jgi:CubicO group peptidase (beta-lactamase class C family)|nr:beta-lactamase family protein [Oscillospiraceae bacterium]
MFSVSKSVTAMAVGFAVAEGRLTVNARAVDLLPELRGAASDETLEKLTVHHLLSMTAGKIPSPMADKSKNRWLADFAEAKWQYAPGEGWNYCNENCYVLCAILHKVCGESVTDYLMPRLFAPLGIPRPFWESDSNGVESGGWGLYLTTEAFAKLMLCCQQGGVYDGKQVIPADWIGLATRKQAQSHGTDEHSHAGYGYCFWMNNEPGSYRADGVFSQLGMVFPAQEAVVVTTGGEIFADRTMDCLARHLPGIFMEEGETPETAPAHRALTLPPLPVLYQTPRNKALERKIEGRMIEFNQAPQAIPQLFGYPVSMMPLSVFFMSAEKAGHINHARLRFQRDTLKFSWSEGKERNTVLCGMDGKPRKCRILLGGIDFTVACTAAWEGSERLHVWIRPLESVAERRLTFVFKGDLVRMLPRSSPSAARVGAYISRFVGEMMPNPMIGQLMSNTLRKIAFVTEPMHFGVMK